MPQSIKEIYKKKLQSANLTMNLQLEIKFGRKIHWVVIVSSRCVWITIIFQSDCIQQIKLEAYFKTQVLDVANA